MKKLLLSVLTVATAVLPSFADTFQKVTSASELTDGDEVVFVHDGTTSYNYSTTTISSSALQSVKVETALTDQINIDSPSVWTVVDQGQSSGKQLYSFKSGTSYLNNSSSTTVNTVSSASDNAKFQLNEETSGKYVYITSPAVSNRHLGWNTTSAWKFYASNNKSSNAPARIYKKVDAGGSQKTKVTLSWSVANQTFKLESSYTAPVLSADPAEALAAVEYVSSNPELLNVTSDGTMTLKPGALGTASVTASIPASNNTYTAAPAVYTLTVIDPNSITDKLVESNFANSTYTDPKDYTSTSTGVKYSGKLLRTNGNIQLNAATTGIYSSENPNGYEITSVVIDWGSNTSSGRGLNVVFSDKAFTSVTTANATKYTIPEDKSATTVNPNRMGMKFVCIAGASAAVYAASITVNYSVTPKKQEAGLSFEQEEVTVDLSERDEDDCIDLQPIINPNNLPVEYVSSDESIAIVIDGKIMCTETGTVTITATSEETDEFLAGKAQYTLSITDLAGVQPITVNEAIIPDGITISFFGGSQIDFASEGADKLDIIIGDFSAFDQPSPYTWTADKVGTHNVIIEAHKGEMSKTLAFTLKVQEDKILVDGQYIAPHSELTLIQGNSLVISTDNYFTTTAEIYVLTEDGENWQGNDDAAGLPFTFSPTELGTYTLSIQTGYMENEFDFSVTVIQKPIVYEEVLDFVNNDYGMTRYTEGTSYNPENTVLTGTEYTYTANQKTRLWSTNGMRIYSTGEMTVSVPEYLQITAIQLGTVNNGNFTAGNISNISVTINEDDKTSGTIAYTAESKNAELKALKVTTALSVDDEQLTPSLEGIVPIPTDDGLEIKLKHDYLGASLHYKHTPASMDARRRASVHDGYIQAEKNDDGQHVITVDGDGILTYYGYHATSNTKGVEREAYIEEGVPTAISSIVADPRSAEIYDLQGRRVNKPARGLYIQGGAKVIR